MHLFNMDQPTWYTCKEMYNTNFTPYYNTVDITNNIPYQYNKNMMPYIEQGNGHITQQYSNLLPESESVLEIGALNTTNNVPNTDLEKDKHDLSSDVKKKNSKSTQIKRTKNVRKKETEAMKNKAHPLPQLKPAPCRGRLKHSECDEVSDEDRNLIYREFQELNSNQAKWQFIASHVNVFAKNKCTSKGPSRREYTHQYFLTVGGNKVRVCRRLFLSTLNVSEAVIRTSLEKLSPQGICEDDNRGKKPPPNKLSASDEEFLRQHILSFPPLNGNPCKWKNSKVYLDSSLSISCMYKMYVNICKDAEKRKPVCIETYRRFCKEYNIIFLKPQKDANKILKSQQVKREHFENRIIPHHLSLNYNEPMIESNQPPNIKSNPPNDFTMSSYVLGIGPTRDYSDRTDHISYFPPPESRRPAPIQPQSSFCQELPTDNYQNSTVIEIGAMSKLSEKNHQSPSPEENKLGEENDCAKSSSSSKLKKLRGESCVDSKRIRRTVRPMKDAPCRNQSKHSMCDTVSDSDRELIYREFCSLRNSQAQWQFIASHVYVYAKSKCTSKGLSRRENTHQYYLTVSGQKVKVCRKFFLATLNVSEAMIRTSLEKLSPQGICQEDNRGRKPPPNKLSLKDENFLRKHILSFRSVDSSLYGKKNTKKYLDSSLSFSRMHKLYVNLCKEQDRKYVSVETYRRICKEYNIAFVKPSKEPPKKCLSPPPWSHEKNPKENILQSEYKESDAFIPRDHHTTPFVSKTGHSDALDFDLHSLLYMTDGP